MLVRLEGRGVRCERHAAAHAQMNHQSVPAAHLDQQVLRPAGQPLDASIDQLRRQPTTVDRLAQTAVLDVDAREARADQMGLQRAAQDLDLGQFRHAPIVAPLPPTADSAGHPRETRLRQLSTAA